MDGAEPSAKSALAAELKAQRAARGWTQVELGKKIGYSGSFVSDVERDDRSPSLDFAQRCDEAFGLLQTQRYARSVIRARRPRDDEESVERTVTARMDRQEILARPRPPMLWYVMAEGVVRHVVGDPEIMGEQVGKLIKAAEAPGIVLQVLPFTAHDHAGTEGPIWIYERPGGPAVAYTECYGGGRLVEGQDEVADLTLVMGMLRAAALSPRESLHLMRAIRRDLDG